MYHHSGYRANQRTDDVTIITVVINLIIAIVFFAVAVAVSVVIVNVLVSVVVSGSSISVQAQRRASCKMMSIVWSGMDRDGL